MPRTTIQLSESLLREAKKAAASSGRSLASFVEEAVQEALGRRQVSRRRERPQLPTSPGAPRPGIDLDDSASLLDAMEDR